MPTTSDLAVIGAGSGGYTAAIRGAQKGLDVVLVERETVGGVCLNHGCIPAKALIHAAGFQKDIDHWNALGIETGPVDVDFDAIQDWKDSVVDQLDQQVLDSLDHHGVELINGTAHFADSTTLQIDSDGGETHTVDFETAIIATGSDPIEIPGLEYDQEGVISSREILQVDEVPDEIVVVGGGYIGMEAVTKFSKFGARVKIVEALDRVLSEFEPEIVESIQETSEMYSDDIYTSTLAQGVEYDDGPVLVAERDDEEIRLSGDYIVVAAGRKPTAAYDRLALDTTDIELTDDGVIAVDDNLQTADNNILAIYVKQRCNLLVIFDKFGDIFLESNIVRERFLLIRDRCDGQAVPENGSILAIVPQGLCDRLCSINRLADPGDRVGVGLFTL